MESKSSNKRIYLYNRRELIAEILLGGISSTSINDIPNYKTSTLANGCCVTCTYWGGIRRVCRNRKIVTSQNLGCCNNPNSLQYQKPTAPDSGSMKAWRKWEALD